MSVRGGGPLLKGMSPENSEGAGPLPVGMAGHGFASLTPMYWVILWVAALGFIRVSAVGILGTLQTEQGCVCRGEDPYLWRKIVLGRE